jgi:hypothetical protein
MVHLFHNAASELMTTVMGEGLLGHRGDDDEAAAVWTDIKKGGNPKWLNGLRRSIRWADSAQSMLLLR